MSVASWGKNKVIANTSPTGHIPASGVSKLINLKKCSVETRQNSPRPSPGPGPASLTPWINLSRQGNGRCGGTDSSSMTTTLRPVTAGLRSRTGLRHGKPGGSRQPECTASLAQPNEYYLRAHDCSPTSNHGLVRSHGCLFPSRAHWRYYSLTSPSHRDYYCPYSHDHGCSMSHHRDRPTTARQPLTGTTQACIYRDSQALGQAARPAQP